MLSRDEFALPEQCLSAIAESGNDLSVRVIKKHGLAHVGSVIDYTDRYSHRSGCGQLGRFYRQSDSNSIICQCGQSKQQHSCQYSQYQHPVFSDHVGKEHAQPPFLICANAHGTAFFQTTLY